MLKTSLNSFNIFPALIENYRGDPTERNDYLPFYDSCRISQKMDDTVDLVDVFAAWMKKIMAQC